MLGYVVVGERDQHPAAHSQLFPRQAELSRGHVLEILPALPRAGRCGSGASCPASWLKFVSGRLLGLVSTEKGDGWWVHACVPTLHSDGPKVSQAEVGTAGPGHGAEEAACGSMVLFDGHSFPSSCSHGCFAMTHALVLLQWFKPATPALNSQVRACALPLSCQGLWGNHLISLLQIPLSWRIPLCCLALPVHGTLHVGLSMD